MRHRTRQCETLVALIFAALIVGGCGPPAAFRIETAVRDDGSCERTIWQPRDGYLPEQAFQPEWIKRWERVTNVTNPPGVQPPKPSPARSAYFIAEGTFRSPDDIPPHYRFVAEQCPQAGASELKRRYEANDAGFVTEHRWREQLTNIVTRADFLEACDELLDIMIPRFVAALQQELGRDYDVAGLSTFIRDDARRLAKDLMVAWFDAVAQHRPEAETYEKLIKMLRRVGLEIDDEEGKRRFDDAEVERRTRELGRRILVKHLRHRDGAPLTAAEADAILNRPSKADGEIARLNEAADEDKKLGRIALRITGLYPPLAFLFEFSPSYEFALRLPGHLVETNGTIEGPNRVRWRFSIDRLYPDGFTMEARSAVIDREAQRQALGRVVIDDQATAAEYLELVGGEGRLLDAVRKLRATGDAGPLRRFQSSSADEARRGKRLRAMILKE